MPIEEIIEKSFNDLIKAITTDGTSSQLIFPHSNKGDVRHSEQELKQIFLRNVEEDKNYFYSIETPTEYGYRFKDSKNLEVDKNHKKGKHQAARFDVSLYTENKIESLASCIEFKHRNSKSICKDLLKLAKEVELTKEKKNFFVHYHYVKETSWKSDTFSNLFEKYSKSVDEIESKIENKEDLSKVIVYLVCIYGKDKSASTYHFSLADLKNNYTVGTKYSDLTDKSLFNEKIFNTEHSI
ncbi:hypothetical protein [Treponema porcinum]|uniref:Uncharacterized protein n=1 Tax=Treponema porcinum TaxID=261392 RepID=A0A1T4N9L4_TREPO|nr:hypothetical protein [Treponema porcinum]SJZ75922.1 hypothetical protein SAMN02745149_02215 [Treponema porcinum]